MPKAQAKLPWMKWYAADWRSDTAIERCSLAARGAMVEFLNVMHLEGRTGSLTGTVDQLARIARCETSEMEAVLEELRVTKSLHVTVCNSQVTVSSRRMLREQKDRLGAAKRVREYRERRNSNDDVTAQRSEVRSQKSKGTNLPKAGKPAPASLDPRIQDWYESLPGPYGTLRKNYHKRKVFAHITKAKLDDETLARIKAYCDRKWRDKWDGTEADMVPSLLTILREERWIEDKPIEDDPYSWETPELTEARRKAGFID